MTLTIELTEYQAQQLQLFLHRKVNVQGDGLGQLQAMALLQVKHKVEEVLTLDRGVYVRPFK